MPDPTPSRPTNTDTDGRARKGGGQVPGRVGPHPASVMSFGDHLEELRKRLILAIAGLLPIFAIAFAFGQPLLRLLIAPAREALIEGGQASTLLATGMFETFGTVVHLSVVVMFLVGAPWVLYQLWLFISPGLYAHERRFVHILLPFSGILVLVSVVFMYLAILPVVLAFFIGFGADISAPAAAQAPLPPGVVLPQIPVLEADPIDPAPGSAWISAETMQLRVAMPDPEHKGRVHVRQSEMVDSLGVVQQYRVSEYIKTLLNLALGFGAAFQTPVVVVMLGWVGLIDPKKMGKYRKHAIVACAVLGAFLTPADPVSMLLMAVPLYLLYELGLFTLRVMPVERVVRGAREPESADA